MRRLREIIDTLENPKVRRHAFFHFLEDDILAKFILDNLLVEERKSVDLGKGRQVFYHSAHVDPGQDHLHFLQRGAKLYSINRDGTAHDASHGKQMDNWATKAVKTHYPSFTLPSGGLIEALMDEGNASILTESLEQKVLLLPAILKLAETKAG